MTLINRVLCLQGVLHWVPESSPGREPVKVEVRLFEKLFNSEVIGSLTFAVFVISG